MVTWYRQSSHQGSSPKYALPEEKNLTQHNHTQQLFGQLIPSSFCVAKNGRSNLSINLSFLLMFFCFCFHTTCACNQEMQFKMHLFKSSYCLITLNQCSDAFIQCTRYQCEQGNTQCQFIKSASNMKSCIKHCCENSNILVSNESDKDIVKQICKQDTPTFKVLASGISNYSVIIIFCSIFLVLTFITCLCKYHRNREIAFQNNQPVVVVSTAVDLNAFNLQTEGPYFINSRDSCAICLDNNVNLRTHCNHFYHGKCLLAWIKKKSDNPCPLCMGIQYNPIKVYCIACHAGDKLVNIQISTTDEAIIEYDSHKCESCQNETFILVEQNQPQNQQNELQNCKDKQKVISQVCVSSVKKSNTKTRQRHNRRNIKTQQIRDEESRTKNKMEEVNQSQKNFHKKENMASL